MVKIAVKRTYEGADPDDGARVLVDRVWPRGVRKDRLCMDAWYKEIAPSPELRKWFNHEPDKWPDFRSRYLQELASRKELAKALLDEQQRGKITLLYSAKDQQHNQALVLRDYLEQVAND